MNRRRLVCLLLALVTLVTYLPVRHHDFVLYDDPDYVQNNEIVQQGFTWEGIKWAFTTGHASNWHPLTWLSHMLDCQLFGPDPGAQHLVNVLIHATNAILFFLLLTRMTGGLWPAAFAAALFAWHPLRVESVAWIAERKDVLCAFFELLALLAYVHYGQKRQWRDYWFTLVFFILALLAKPMAVTLPFLLLLLDYWPLKRLSSLDEDSPDRPAFGRVIGEKSPFFLLAAGASVTTYLVQQAEAVVTLHDYSLSLRLGNAVIGYGWYLLKFIWPVNLTVYYPAQLHILWPQFIAALAVIIAVSIATWVTRKTKPYLLVGWLWYLGTLVPVIGLVQVGSQAEADRYSYIPMMGLLIAIAASVQTLLVNKRVQPNVPAALGAIALGACILATSQQLRFWQDSLQLFRRAVNLTKDNALANINLAAALVKLGHKNEAAARYREALRIVPRDGLTHDNFANVLADMGHTNEARFEYEEALKYKSDSPVVHCDFGAFLAGTGRFEEAIQHYEKAVSLVPKRAYPYYLMGKARLHQGHGAEAVALFRKALSLDPANALCLTSLSRTLATDEDASVRNPKDAITMAEQANELTGGQQSFVLDTLAAAYAEGGRFPDAIQTVHKAITVAQNAGDKDVLVELQKRLTLYQSNKPYHEAFPGQKAKIP